MLTQKQIDEIREHLNNAQNPVFFYDNDVDGLCSYLLLRRYLGRGKGVAIKSYPDINAQYANKVREFKADYIFILDKPLISSEFLQVLEQYQIPIVWIDHHDVEQPTLPVYPALYIYNPTRFSKNHDCPPTTQLCYSVTQHKEDCWLEVIGSIADNHMPQTAELFAEHFPDLWGKVKSPFDIYYTTEIGKLAQALSFGIKDSITHVVALQNFLLACSSPRDIFSESPNNLAFRKRNAEIRKKYLALVEQALNHKEKNLLFFEYAGDLSISAELSNELSYRFPNTVIVVAYTKGASTNLSLRGKNIKKALLHLLSSFPMASGGGHPDAVGARLPTSDLARFREEIGEIIT